MSAYHVSLGGVGFLIEPSSYGRRALATVPPGALVNGAGPAGVDPFFERVQRQSRFSAGAGIDQFQDPAEPDGFSAGSGVVVAPGGSLTLGPLLEDAGAGAIYGDGARALAVFHGQLYAGTAGATGEVWRWDGATWTLAFTTGGSVASMAVFRDALYLGSGANGNVWRWDGASVTLAWSTAAASISALAMAWFDGSPRLFVGNSVGSGQAWVDSFDGAARGTVAFLEEPRVEALAAGSGRLFIASSDPSGQPSGALYTFTGTASSVVRERSFGDGYAVSLAWMEDRLALGWSRSGRVLTWEPSPGRLAEVRGAEAARALGGVARLVLWDEGTLWVGLRDASTGAARLWRYGPGAEGWSLAATGGSCESVDAAISFGGDLFVGLGASGAGSVLRLRQDRVAASGTLESAPFDLGLGDLDKAFRSVVLEMAPLPAGATLGIDYKLSDADAWLEVGTASIAGATEATLPFPAGVRGRRTRLRARLSRGAGISDSPELRAWSVHAALVPPVRREWSFAVLAEGDAQRPLLRLDNTPEPRTAREIASDLWSLRAEPGPLAFVDLDGSAYEVWLRDLNEAPQKARALDGSQPWTRAQVRLVEAG